MRATAEMALETEAQGAAFLDTVRATWPNARLDAGCATIAADRGKPSGNPDLIDMSQSIEFQA